MIYFDLIKNHPYFCIKSDALNYLLGYREFLYYSSIFINFKIFLIFYLEYALGSFFEFFFFYSN